jgi:hypothetical protein
MSLPMSRLSSACPSSSTRSFSRSSSASIAREQGGAVAVLELLGGGSRSVPTYYHCLELGQMGMEHRNVHNRSCLSLPRCSCFSFGCFPVGFTSRTSEYIVEYTRTRVLLRERGG